MKEIVFKNQKYIYNSNQEYGEHFFSYGELNDKGELTKVMDFSATYPTGDYSFSLSDFICEDNTSLSFHFDNESPMMDAVEELLITDDPLTIYDDFTRDEEDKKLVISRDAEGISFTFFNPSCPGMYEVGVKNVLYDGRSKIDQMGYETKNRLYNCLKRSRKAFMSNNMVLRKENNDNI